MATAYLGLGANLGDRRATLARALEALAPRGVEVAAVSPTYETDAVAPRPQPRYLNAVARVATALPPRDLLIVCLEVEQTLGRVRPPGQEHAARTIDIDLLLYDDAVIDDPPTLVIPHPRMLERAFVRVPLADVAAPGLAHPITGEALDRWQPESNQLRRYDAHSLSDEHESLRRLLSGEEGQYFDRKSLFQGIPGEKRPRDPKEVRRQIAEYVAAFANADGGTLILGVEDDATVTGHRYAADKVEEMLRVPEVRLRPQLPQGRTLSLDGHDLLIFDVRPAARAVMVIGNGFPRREGDEVILSSEETINRLKDAGLVTSPEARLADQASFDDLDLDLVHRAITAGAFEGSPEDYLVQRRLADRRGHHLALRNGAVWLFAKSPEAIEHPNLGVRVFRVTGTELVGGARRNVQDFPWIEGNLLSVLTKARDIVGSLIRSSSRLHDLFFRETPEYPPLAWQEALVNALAHRDYGIESRCSEIYLFDDRMEVISPGGLVAPVTIQALQERKRVHASRNPRVARVLTELGIMRQQGEGIPRMIEEMELSWLPPPALRADASEFAVALRNEPIFDGGDPAWTAFVRDLPLNVRQKRALVALADREFTSGDYQTLNQIDRDLAYRELQDMEEHDLLRADGATRGRKYSIQKPVVVAPRAGLPPILRLVDRMAEAGRLTNTDYRDAFDVSRAEARRALTVLVRDGVLELVGERRGAHYLPGPRWPPTKE